MAVLLQHHDLCDVLRSCDDANDVCGNMTGYTHGIDTHEVCQWCHVVGTAQVETAVLATTVD